MREVQGAEAGEGKEGQGVFVRGVHMSVEIRAKIICDNCKSWIQGEAATTTTYAVESYSLAKQQAIADGWVILRRFGKPRHLCPKCQDGEKPSETQGKLAMKERAPSRHMEWR